MGLIWRIGFDDIFLVFAVFMEKDPLFRESGTCMVCIRRHGVYGGLGWLL